MTSRRASRRETERQAGRLDHLQSTDTDCPVMSPAARRAWDGAAPRRREGWAAAWVAVSALGRIMGLRDGHARADRSPSGEPRDQPRLTARGRSLEELLPFRVQRETLDR